MRRSHRNFERRRRALRLQFTEHFEAYLETHSTATPIGVAALGISALGATALAGSMHANGGVMPR